MGLVTIPVAVKLICAVTFSQQADPDSVLSDLVKKYGAIDVQSELFSFTQTEYYKKEMGDNLRKLYLSFKNLIMPERIVHIKLETNLLEKKYTIAGNRSVNLDPGYLEKAKLILVTTKNFSHRIYLGSGIFGDVQLRIKGGKFQIHEWTYPDYREEKVIRFFRRIRDRYCREADEWAKSN
ncbi:MAG TPA: DUF4416 family protein [Bacteroidetes bacterium]|nr:DUF4416 family protein [Bacteroidota bacterium]